VTWTRKDSKSRVHAKCAKAGNDGASFWHWAIEYSNDNGTDGFLDEGILHKIFPNEIPKKKAKELAEKCVAASIKPGGAGLLERVEGGYLIHDFADYQPPSNEELKKQWLSEKRSEAGRRGASKRWQKPDDPPMANDGLPLAKEDDNDGNGESPRAGARRTGIGDGSGSGDLKQETVGYSSELLTKLARSYAEGIADGGNTPWSMPDAGYEAPFLLTGLQTHKPQLRGEQIFVWVRRSAATYRRAMSESAQFQKGFRPSKWLEWLNSGQPEANSQTRVRAVPSRSTQPDIPDPEGPAKVYRS
jgi:hypothetical protein